MAGLLNAEQEQSQEPEMLEEKVAPESAKSEQGMQDPALKQIEQGIEAAVPKELKKAYMQVLVAGMKVMFSQNTSKFMEQRLANAQDPVQAVSTGIADLLMLIYNESKRTMSIPAAMLAAFSLMAQALDYAEKIGAIQVTPELIEQCTEATWQAATAKFGITKDKIDQVIAQSQQGGQQEEPEQSEEQSPMTEE